MSVLLTMEIVAMRTSSDVATIRVVSPVSAEVATQGWHHLVLVCLSYVYYEIFNLKLYI